MATATTAAFKLIEIANFLNGRESRYLSDRDKQKKRADDLNLKLGETVAAYDDYRNKYALQTEMATTLVNRERELEDLTKKFKELEVTCVQLDARN
jgi:hypothetical protein